MRIFNLKLILLLLKMTILNFQLQLVIKHQLIQNIIVDRNLISYLQKKVGSNLPAYRATLCCRQV